MVETVKTIKNPPAIMLPTAISVDGGYRSANAKNTLARAPRRKPKLTDNVSMEPEMKMKKEEEKSRERRKRKKRKKRKKRRRAEKKEEKKIDVSVQLDTHERREEERKRKKKERRQEEQEEQEEQKEQKEEEQEDLFQKNKEEEEANKTTRTNNTQTTHPSFHQYHIKLSAVAKQHQQKTMYTCQRPCKRQEGKAWEVDVAADHHHHRSHHCPDPPPLQRRPVHREEQPSPDAYDTMLFLFDTPPHLSVLDEVDVWSQDYLYVLYHFLYVDDDHQQQQQRTKCQLFP